MASTDKIIPIIDNKPFARWMAASRAAQAFISVAVICLDIFAIDEWNKDQFSFNSYFGQASSFSLHTDIGTTPFTGIVMFTVRPSTYSSIQPDGLLPCADV